MSLAAGLLAGKICPVLLTVSAALLLAASFG
jgi:hypothetical protein